MRLFKPDFETLSDEELCSRLQSDRAAFDALYDRYSQRLFQYLLRMLSGQRERAEDLLQDVFVQVYEQSGRFDPGRRFSTWIFAIAHHKVCNEYRAREVRHRAADQLTEAPATTPIEDLLDRRTFCASLLEALAAHPLSRIFSARVPAYQALLGAAAAFLLLLAVEGSDPQAIEPTALAPIATPIATYADSYEVMANVELLEHQRRGKVHSEDSLLIRFPTSVGSI